VGEKGVSGIPGLCHGCERRSQGRERPRSRPDAMRPRPRTETVETSHELQKHPKLPR